MTLVDYAKKWQKYQFNIVCDLQNFQDECEAKLKVLEEAASSSQKMTYHQDADEQVARFKVGGHTCIEGGTCHV